MATSGLAYYNENDQFAARWLRNLIEAGEIAPGDVDGRSIVDVRPSDIAGYSQCHFFAGIGGWSYALRLAGWPDDRPVWTGSCPCQPFSAAGKQRGTADERHLWPEFLRLIAECAPATVFGEQVASRLGRDWLAAVRSDLEALGYAIGAADLCAAGVGAPHIRQRLWWVADCSSREQRRVRERREGDAAIKQSAGGYGAASGLADALRAGRTEGRAEPGHGPIASGGSVDWMADAAKQGRGELAQRTAGADGRAEAEPRRLCDSSRLADADGGDAGSERQQRSGEQRLQPQDSGVGVMGDAAGAGRERIEDGGQPLHPQRSAAERASGHADAWSDAEWLPCRDGKARPTQPGLHPLAHGIPGRASKLRAYGNAIVPQAAAEFIKAACG